VRTEPAAQPTVKSNGQKLLVIQNHQHGQADLTYGLSAAGFDVDAASTGEQAVRQASQTAYDAITLDLLLPDESGLKILQAIRSEGRNRESPVVSVSMSADRGSAATFAIANVLSKPIDNEEIAHAMQRFLSKIPRTARVMVIDDDPMALDLMCTTLGGMGIDCIGLMDGRQALAEIELHRPDAIVLDLMMPEFDGFAVLDALRRIPIWRDTPVFIWTSMVLSSEEYASLKRSAHTILSKGGGDVETMLDDLRNRRQG
jgi:CheY-like chemotaxis protein